MTRNAWIAVFLSFLVLLVVSNALAEEKAPVKMLGVAILSGKLGAINETGWGFSDGAKNVNETKMIKDHKFDLILEDGQYEVPLSVSIINRVLAAEPKNELLFSCGWQTGVLHSIAEKVRETHLVCVDGSMSTVIFDDNVKKNFPYYFSIGVPYGDQCGALFKFIKTKLHKGKKKPRVAFVYIDATAGKDPLKKMRMYAKNLGIDLVMEEPVTFQTTDFTPTLMKIRKAKADYLVLWSWSVPVSTRFIKTARKYLPKTEILGLSYLAWEIFFATLKDAFNGVYVLSPYPRPSETKNPLVARMLKSAKEGKHALKIWDLYFQGYLMALICAEGAKRAGAAGDLSRDGVQKALASLKDWDAFGMYDGKTFDYSAHKFPRARILRANFKTKSLEPATEWFLVDEYVK